MKVKLLTSRAGIGFSQNAGEEIEVSDKEGLSLIKAGQADAVQVRETATKQTNIQKRAK